MLRTILLTLIALSLAVPAFAQDAAPAKAAGEAKPADAKPAAPAFDPTKMGPMTRPVKKVKVVLREVRAFLKAEDQAMKKKDLAASMALIDFPVWMVTDDAKGEASGYAMTKEAFEAMMKPFYEMPTPKNMKMSRKNAITPLSPSLAVVVTTWHMRMGKKKGSWKSAHLLVKKGGQWKSQVMVEAGWGDMNQQAPAGK